MFCSETGRGRDPMRQRTHQVRLANKRQDEGRVF